MGSLRPGTINFTGADKILQGTTWVREVNFGQDMSAFIGSLTRTQFKKSDGTTVVYATADSSVVLTWINSNTTLRFTILPATSSGKAASTGNFEVEAVSSGGAVERILTGAWEQDSELCTAST